MTFRDWSYGDSVYFEQEAQERILQEIESYPYLSGAQQDEADELFKNGWLTFGEFSPAELQVIRDDFYDLLGIEEGMFDCTDYRHLHSEVSAGPRVTDVTELHR